MKSIFRSKLIFGILCVALIAITSCEYQDSGSDSVQGVFVGNGLTKYLDPFYPYGLFYNATRLELINSSTLGSFFQTYSEGESSMLRIGVLPLGTDVNDFDGDDPCLDQPDNTWRTRLLDIESWILVIRTYRAHGDENFESICSAADSVFGT